MIRLLTYFCSSVVLFQPKTPKTVNFKEYPVDLEGPIVVPEEEAPAKPVKQEKKFFDFFKKKKKVGRNYELFSLLRTYYQYNIKTNGVFLVNNKNILLLKTLYKDIN